MLTLMFMFSFHETPNYLLSLCMLCYVPSSQIQSRYTTSTVNSTKASTPEMQTRICKMTISQYVSEYYYTTRKAKYVNR